MAAKRAEIAAETDRKVITQHELHRLFRADSEIAELKADLAAAERSRDGLASSLLELHEARVPVQSGRFILVVDKVPGARRPKWKEICEAKNGAAFVKRVIAATPAPVKTKVSAIPSV